MDNKFLELGTIAKTSGLQGEVKLLLDSHIIYQPQIKTASSIYLFVKQAGTWQPLVVSQIQKSQKTKTTLLLKFQNYDSATKANSLIGYKLYALKTDLSFQIQPLWTDYQAIVDGQNKLILETWNNGHYDLVKVQLTKPLWVPLIPPYLVEVKDESKELILDLKGLE
ncbi:ribosomal 30S subunit maturation factor RimM [Entomoplasma freundtii]|uniref:16S rRNA processing protein RimM n=1 Tax=Entomoplasma freundtii TaxID=74700 RepID=A0A2K8NUH9_9MOLU|nr:hypothetical protein [Entomoplasma freundtii]ATZ16421.1 16S rRNA processing protein RimM [Entomoplasma freundtii]TDY56540.1 ribosomal 30S subunit maturation factor RimM [Entomoplasma freundtii]